MNTEERPHLRAYSEPYWGSVALALMGLQNGQPICGELTVRPLKPEEEHTRALPLVQLSPHHAQVLMDDLWRCGLRPSEGTGSAGALAATERHLRDLQALVFKTQPKEQP